MSASQNSRQVYVWDRMVRFFHWSVLVIVVAIYVTGESGMQYTHELIGYGLSVLLAVRFAWGWIGSGHARFHSFIQSPSQVLRYFSSIVRGQPKHYLGHNPAGGAMVLALLVTLTLMVVSGLVILATIEFEGPLVAVLHNVTDQTAYLWFELHELALDILFVLIAMHIAGVAVASVQHRENLPRSMITGYKSTTNEGLGNES